MKQTPHVAAAVLALLGPLLVEPCALANESLWGHLSDAADLQDVRGVAVEFAGPPPVRRITLHATGGQSYAWVSLPAPPGGWDLATRRAVEAVLTNIGEDPLEAMLWVVADAGWECIADVAVLPPGESRTFSCALRKTFPDGTPKLDPTRVRAVQIMLKNPKPGQAIEIAELTAVGDALQWMRPPGRLDVPAVEDRPPMAGRRFFHRLDEPRHDSTTQPAAILWLPRDWQPKAAYPVIIEYPGNIFFTADCYSTGQPEQCVIGYGMTRGVGAIWVSLPFVDAAGHVIENGWGDPDATAAFCVDVVEDVCQRFGGDRSRVVLTGFSRGAIACGFIGLRDDRIAALWKGLHCCQHFDGDGWNGATLEDAVERARRFRGTSVFHTDNPAASVKPIGDALRVPVEFASSGLGGHSCAMFLDDRESTRRLREWFSDLVESGSAAP
ncbi:MAG: hypothetical protein K8S94_06790 [Planctomycetia bacterium]|nr:hypothetical protein [Planctomycetia bacterium]